MDIMIHETEDGELIDLMFEFIPDNQKDWSATRHWKDFKWSCDPGDPSLPPALNIEYILLDRRIVMRGEKVFLARMGYSNFRNLFLVSKYAELKREDGKLGYRRIELNERGYRKKFME